jgi:hypothetical protein
LLPWAFWTAAVVLIWPVSGVYLTFSQELRRAVSALSPLTMRAALLRSGILWALFGWRCRSSS